MKEHLLNNLGLSEVEVQVYLACLELGLASIQEISRHSGVKRTSIYNFLDELKLKQLITETKKGKRTLYSAVRPAHLLEQLKTKVTEFEKIVPELDALHANSKNKPSVRYYEGVKGINEVYLDVLIEEKTVSAWVDWDSIKKTLGSQFILKYPAERAKRGIEFKQITRDSKKAREICSRDKKELRTSKLLSCSSFNTEIMIYGNKLAIISFREQNPFALLIEDQGITTTLKIAWDELWKRL